MYYVGSGHKMAARFTVGPPCSWTLNLLRSAKQLGKVEPKLSVVSRKQGANGVSSSLESEDENPALEFELKTREGT